MNLISKDALELLKSIFQNKKNSQLIGLYFVDNVSIKAVEGSLPLTKSKFMSILHQNDYFCWNCGQIEEYEVYLVTEKKEFLSEDTNTTIKNIIHIINIEKRYYENIYDQFNQSFVYLYDKYISNILKSDMVCSCSYDVLSKKLLLSDSFKKIINADFPGIYVNYPFMTQYLNKEDAVVIARETIKIINGEQSNYQGNLRFINCKYQNAYVQVYVNNTDHEGNPIIINYLLVFEGLFNTLDHIDSEEINVNLTSSDEMGLWQYDLKKKCITFNKVMQTMLGFSKRNYTIDEIRNIANKKGPYYLEKYYQIVDLYRKYGSFDVDIDFKKNNIEERFRFFAMKIYRKADDAIVMGYVKNCTDEIEIERAKNKNERLRIVGNMASSVAHDFNNTLMAAYGYLDLLKKCNIDENAQNYIVELLKIADIQKDTISKLLTYVKSSKESLYTSNIVNLTNETVNFAKSSLTKSVDILLDIKIDEGYVDITQSDFQSILFNLLVNARDAIDGNGEINMIVDSKNIDSLFGYVPKQNDFIPGEYIIVSVIDKGIGISPKKFEKIFEPYYTTKINGNGIGLSNVLRTIKQYNGYISFDSIEGQGTTFYIYLPNVCKKEKMISEQDYMSLINPKLYTIMLIDDDNLVATIVGELLRNEGFKVIIYNNQFEALDFYKFNYPKIDLVLLDMLLPQMNGDKVFEKMIKMNPNLNCIMLSGYCEDEKTKELIDNGLKGFIQKPVDANQLKQNVAKTIVNLSEKCFDESLALYMLAGNLTVYELTKKNYIENFEYLDQYIITYNNNHDYEGIRVLIHRLRGISINIGSRKLYRYATYVDEMLKEYLDIKLVKDELSKIVEINNEIINKLRGE